MTVRRRSSVVAQAEAQAIGGSQGVNAYFPDIIGSDDLPLVLKAQAPTTGMGRAFDAGRVAEIRVRAWYPPTRTFYDVTNFVQGISWSDAADQAAVSAAISLDNGNGRIGAVMNRPGMVFFVETRARSGFTERLRVIAWDTTITDISQGTLEITAFDHLIYLMVSKGSFKYVADDDHEDGWTASQIVRDIIEKYRIPVLTEVVTQYVPLRYRKGERKGKVIKDKNGKIRRKRVRVTRARLPYTDYKIKHFVLQSATVFDAIAAAYAVDTKKTKHLYFIEAAQGKLRVRRADGLPPKHQLVISSGSNLRSATFTRSLTDGFGSNVVPTGTDLDEDNNPVPRARYESKTKYLKKHLKANASAEEKKAALRAYEKKLAEFNRKVAQKETLIQRARAAGEAPSLEKKELQREGRLASEILFGNVTLEQHGSHFTVHDGLWSREAAQAFVDRMARAKKTLTLVADGNTLVKQGDLIYVVIPFSDQRSFRKELYVSRVTHTISPGDYEMEIECAWRIQDVADQIGKQVQPDKKESESEDSQTGGGRTVGASVFGGPGDPGTGSQGYRGDNLNGKMAFAELGYPKTREGGNLGSLPYKSQLRITYNGKSVVGTKLDIGAGGGDVQGHRRDIDLWYELAAALGFKGGLDLVQIENV